MRRVGSYIMWVAIAATCVTSSMFLTALAPNLLAVELVRKTAKIEITWLDWFMYFAPVGIVLLAALPLLVMDLSAAGEGGGGGPGLGGKRAGDNGAAYQREIMLAVLVVIALVLWIFRGDEVNATTAALIIISLMLLTNVVTWRDITKNSAAWNTLVWFATLVALADGLTRVGFVNWFAETVATKLEGVFPQAAVAMLLLINFFGHYLFASVTAHVTAMIPVLLAVASTVPGSTCIRSHSGCACSSASWASHALRERSEPGVLR